MRQKWSLIRAVLMVGLFALFGIVKGSQLSMNLIAASRPRPNTAEPASNLSAQSVSSRSSTDTPAP